MSNFCNSETLIRYYTSLCDELVVFEIFDTWVKCGVLVLVCCSWYIVE